MPLHFIGASPDHPSLLAGIICDGEGRPMSPSHTNKGPKRYRYYVTHEAHVSQQQPVWRVAAHDLEAIITERLAKHLSDPAASVGIADQHRGDADRRVAQVGRARDLLQTGTDSERRQVLLDHVAMVALHEDRITITLADGGLRTDSNATLPANLSVAATRIRRGHDIRLVVAAPAPAVPKRDERLVLLVADAVATRERLQAMGNVSIAKAAAWLGCCRSTLTDRIKLSYLAPDIVEAILAGRQPRSLTRRRLATTDLPIDWRLQRKMLGFD